MLSSCLMKFPLPSLSVRFLPDKAEIIEKEKRTKQFKGIFEPLNVDELSMRKRFLFKCIYHLQVFNPCIHPCQHLFPLLRRFWTWVQSCSEPEDGCRSTDEDLLDKNIS